MCIRDRRVDRVVVCSRFLHDCFAPRSPALAAKTTVVFNGVNRKIFFPKEEIRERRTIFFVGRLEAEKGVLQLIQTYARVLQDHPDATLVIGGATGFGIHQETAYVRRVRELANSCLLYTSIGLRSCGRWLLRFARFSRIFNLRAARGGKEY